ncbi:MAG: hypothetical protein F6K19_46655 [Cyanothece sp. SIO1E1]|nr:hypothetical protein [Cyanothece sp. SIO1E1]
MLNAILDIPTILDTSGTPFEGLTVFNLDAFAFTTGDNPNVEAADSIPFISIERTPDELIINNQETLGPVSNTFDFFAFSISEGNSRGIFDIDGGFVPDLPGSTDTELFLFDLVTGELLANNDDFPTVAGAGGSISNLDAFIDFTLPTVGTFVIGVGALDSINSLADLITGNTPDIGDTFTLQVSLEGLNDAPAIATNEVLTIDEGGTGVITNALLNEGDPDDNGADLIFTLTSTPTSGTLSLENVALKVGDTFTLVICSIRAAIWPQIQMWQ